MKRLLLIAGLTVTMHAAPIVYDYTVGSGGTMVSGDTNIGISCDDCTQSVNLPFNVTFYGVSYNTVNVSSNGNLQFNTSSTSFSNGSIPTATFGATMLPFWDDLFITRDANSAGTGAGIFTSIHGSGSNRIFAIRFAESVCCTSTATPELNYMVLLYENSSMFRFVYGSMTGSRANGASATIGVQENSTNGTLFSLNSASVSNGTVITFDVNHNVPEPSTYSLIGIGGALLAASRFLRRR